MRRSQKGSVLLLSLSILTIIAAISLLVLTRSTNAVIFTSSIIDKEKANILSSAILTWAQASLLENPVPSVFPGRIVDGVQLSGSLVDAQSLFNINLMHLSSSYDASNLLERLILQTSSESGSPDDVVRFIRSWITEVRMGSSQYDNQYREKRYRAAHTEIVDQHSLRLVHGVTKTLFEALSPFIVALPVEAKLNINSLNKRVLMALVPGLTSSEADELILLREQRPFENIAEFSLNPLVKRHDFKDSALLTVQSEFFIVNAVVKNAKSSIHRQWLLKRINESTVEVVWVS